MTSPAHRNAGLVGRIGSTVDHDDPYPEFAQELNNLLARLRLAPPPPPGMVGTDGRKWREGPSPEIPWERDLEHPENRAVMDSMEAIVQAAQLLNDIQLMKRIADAAEALRKKKRRKQIFVGGDSTPPPGPIWTLFMGIATTAIFRRESIHLHGKLFDGNYGDPCSRDFILLMSVVYHEARHTAGDHTEEQASAGTIRALQAVRDNIDNIKMFQKCTPAERAEIKQACDQQIAAQAMYAGINEADAAAHDRDKARRPGRGA